MKVLKIFLILVLLSGILCYVYVNRKKLIALIRSFRDEKSQLIPPIRQITASEEGKAFIFYADNFQGLYETLYKASQGVISAERMKNVLTEWDIRMGNISQAPASLSQWWSTLIAGYDSSTGEELQSRAQLIFQMIQSSGIVRDEKKEFIAADDITMYYQTLEGALLTPGQKIRVESPCWFLPGNPVRIIEKGLCEIL
jgi:hypothetical protein